MGLGWGGSLIYVYTPAPPPQSILHLADNPLILRLPQSNIRDNHHVIVHVQLWTLGRIVGHQGEGTKY